MIEAQQTWTIKAALDWTVEYLASKNDENPSVAAHWLIGDACGYSRVEVYLNLDRPLLPDEREKLRRYVARRAAGEPLQYITGQAAFRYLTLNVRPGVLIPRPETEVLVSEALSILPAPKRRHSVDSCMTDDQTAEALARAQYLQLNSDIANDGEGSSGFHDESGQQEQDAPIFVDAPSPDNNQAIEVPFLVADICTGTGCIALAIATEHQNTNVIATDISSDAVALARENVTMLEMQQRVAVLQGNLGECIPDKYVGNFDLVVSNPPYVPTCVMSEIPDEVANFEPALALDGGADGLDIYRQLLVWCARALKPGAAFVCELHETCLGQAAQLACEAGFMGIKITKDLAGKDRVITVFKPSECGE